MFLQLLRAETDKLFKRRLFWIGSAILIALIALYLSIFFSFRGNMPGSLVEQFLVWPQSLVVSLNFASGFNPLTSWGTFLLIIVIGTVTAQEYSWRTMQLWLSRGISRPRLLLAKYVSALLPAFLLLLACLFIGAALTALFSYVIHGSINIGQINFGRLLVSIVLTTYTMLPYAALAFMLAIVTRSTAAAVAGALGFIVVAEPLLSNVLPFLGKTFAQLVQYLPAGLAQVIGAQNYLIANEAIPPAPAGTPDLPVALIGVALYTLIFCGIALWAFQRQDLTN